MQITKALLLFGPIGEVEHAAGSQRAAAAPGQHVVTGKAIEPLAPSANPARFTRAAKVAKWFQRNCNDVLQRPCTAQEKGDVLAWLLTLPAKETR